MGFFDKLFKKKEETKEEKPAEKPKVDPASTKASFKAEAPAQKPAEAPKAAAPKAEGGNPDPYAFIVPPVASPGDGSIPKDATLPAADLGPLLPGAPAGGKIKLAVYWTAACGGCDVSLLDTHERLLTIGDMAEIVMWPVAADGKEKDIEAMADGEITVSLINGAIRNSENEHMAKLLRQKSKIVVAYGTCAMFGGSPALANLVPGGAQEILDYVYTKTPSSANFQADYHKDAPVIPQTSYQAPEGELTIPTLYDTVKTLDQVVDVDYSIPGCPPLPESISQLLKAVEDFVYNGVPLPPKGTPSSESPPRLCARSAPGRRRTPGSPRSRSPTRSMSSPTSVSWTRESCVSDPPPSADAVPGAPGQDSPAVDATDRPPMCRSRVPVCSQPSRRCSPSWTRTRPAERTRSSRS